jgi:hypothetical protein
MQRFVQIPSKNLQFEFEPFATLKKVLKRVSLTSFILSKVCFWEFLIFKKFNNCIIEIIISTRRTSNKIGSVKKSKFVSDHCYCWIDKWLIVSIASVHVHTHLCEPGLLCNYSLCEFAPLIVPNQHNTL